MVIIDQLKLLFRNSLIFKGSLISISLRFINIIIGYFLTGIISRNYGAEGLGQYHIFIHFIAFTTVVSLFGMDKLLLKIGGSALNEVESQKHLRSILSLTLEVGLFASIILAIVISGFSSLLSSYFLHDVSLYWLFLIAAWLLPFSSLRMLLLSFARVVNKIFISEFFSQFFQRIVLLFGLLTFLFIGYSIDLSHLILLFSIGFIVSTLLPTYLFKDKFEWINFKVLKDYWRNNNNYFSESFVFYQSSLIGLASSHALIFVLALLLSPKEVGIYKLSEVLAGMITIIAIGVNIVIAPKISQLFYKEKKRELQDLFDLAGKILLGFSIPLSLVIIFFGRDILQWFGKDFEGGYHILVVLTIAYSINTITGPVGIALDMIGEQKFRRNVLFFSGIATIVSAVIGIHLFGSLALAYSMLLLMSISNVVGIVYAWKKYRLITMFIPFFREK